MQEKTDREYEDMLKPHTKPKKKKKKKSIKSIKDLKDLYQEKYVKKAVY